MFLNLILSPTHRDWQITRTSPTDVDNMCTIFSCATATTLWPLISIIRWPTLIPPRSAIPPLNKLQITPFWTLKPSWYFLSGLFISTSTTGGRDTMHNRTAVKFFTACNNGFKMDCNHSWIFSIELGWASKNLHRAKLKTSKLDNYVWQCGIQQR